MHASASWPGEFFLMREGGRTLGPGYLSATRGRHPKASLAPTWLGWMLCRLNVPGGMVFPVHGVGNRKLRHFVCR